MGSLTLLNFKNLFYIFILFGALIMLINMVIASSLKKRIPGGFVGKWLAIMFVFMLFFFIAEAGSFFFISYLTNMDLAYFLISLVLFFGSIFVAIVNRFIFHLIKELEVRK
ncbi:MAG: hypothetical protein EVJ46_08720 [Candidatus Acididesulfobacter guangdongensis]|uniref:Uncharacterized protein n=1 Tax=Acididesulfobacter guangdongensis TaxID=2597225 RepID=A0A519BEB3_ACIG2|nr:MAG: hypothetical protein EVJ46_08720 [Candidatus Acididesulfobacter guangdongensis]